MMKNLLLEAVEYKITETLFGAWRRFGIGEYVWDTRGAAPEAMEYFRALVSFR
ncbi:MAG: hypothetical protein Q7U02_10625 [Desulfosalsimonadaceae bacterium]|nr:hypothetical protein [Desulfosalsimonadaceae bacterium]